MCIALNPALAKVKFKNLQATQELLCAAESAHLFSIQDVQSQRGRGAAWGWGKAGWSAVEMSVQAGVTIPGTGTGLWGIQDFSCRPGFLYIMGIFFP